MAVNQWIPNECDDAERVPALLNPYCQAVLVSLRQEVEAEVVVALSEHH